MLAFKVDNQPANITNWISCYAFDVMGDIAMGIDFDMLKDGKKHPAIQHLHASMKSVAIAGTIPWLAPLLLYIPSLSPIINPFRHLCHSLFEKRRHVCPVYKFPEINLSNYVFNRP